MPPEDDDPILPDPLEVAEARPAAVFPARESGFTSANDDGLGARLRFLQQEHADLDMAIEALGQSPSRDSLALARLKKRKLLLKDQIQDLKDRLTPDIIA